MPQISKTYEIFVRKRSYLIYFVLINHYTRHFCCLLKMSDHMLKSTTSCWKRPSIYSSLVSAIVQVKILEFSRINCILSLYNNRTIIFEILLYLAYKKGTSPLVDFESFEIVSYYTKCMTFNSNFSEIAEQNFISNLLNFT